VSPSPSSPPSAELHRLALELAQGAGELARAGRAEAAAGDGLSVATKSTSTDLVTEIDRRTERWLVERIGERRPGDGVLGEEGAGRPTSTGVRWVLDPIDGTVNFVLGLPQYAVSVAAEYEGQVLAGAVVKPVSGECFHAYLGGGAFLGSTRLHGPRPVPLARAVIGTGFGYDAARRARQAAVLAELLPRVGDVRRMGAASLDLCAVAAGRLDGYYEAGLNYWDYAAGVLIATEAGCQVSGGTDAVASVRLTAVTGPELAGPLFGLLRELGADRVVSS
jgi:myo-inositol-1(or 4)-monophosphatase